MVPVNPLVNDSKKRLLSQDYPAVQIVIDPSWDGVEEKSRINRYIYKPFI